MTEKKHRRRENGTGTVYEDKARGRWIGAVTIGGRRRKVVASTRTEARKRLESLIREAEHGVPPGHGNATVADALDAWERRVLPGRDLGSSTQAIYRWCIERWREELGQRRLRALTIEDVEAVLDRAAAGENGHRPAARSTLVKLRSVLSQALDHAERRGMIARNVAKLAVLTPTARRPEPRNVLDADQARRLWSVLDGERYGPLFGFMLTAGLRPGEAAGVLWDDLDLDAGTVTVRHAVRLENRRPVVVDELKTAASVRRLALTPAMVAMLRRHRAAQAGEKLRAERWADDRLVTATRNGTPLGAPNIRRELARLCELAEVPAVRPNELRHSAASIMSEQGVPLERIADQLGHTTTRMLEQTYRHRLAPVETTGADVMARVFGPVSSAL